MFWNRYFWPSFLIMLVVVILHWVASYEGLYWYLSWYDIMMHFLGGLWVCAFALWVAHTQYGRRLAPYLSVVNLILSVFVVGILWEVHELVLDFAFLDAPGYWNDTLLDLVMDVVGGLVMVLAWKGMARTQ